MFCLILLIMWMGGFKNGEKLAYVIKAWLLTYLSYTPINTNIFTANFVSK